MGSIVRLVLLNYYAIAAAVVVGAVSGAASVAWIRGGVHDGPVAVRAAAIGIGGTLVLSAGGFLITGLDGFTLIHVVYLVLTVGVPLAAAIVLVMARERSRVMTALCLAALLAIPVGIYATHIEPFWLRTDSVELTVDGVGERIRVGVLSDLQTTEIGPYENEAVDRLIASTPDMVVVPGDLYQFDPDLFDERAPQFSGLIQRLVDAVPIVFLVSGNTDTVADLLSMTEGTGAKVLDNRVETLVVNGNVVSVGGITLFGDEGAAQRVADQLADDDQAGVRILLAHKPDEIELLGGRSVDLLVAGHTHGGQVSLPFLGPPLTLSRRSETCSSRRAARVGRDSRVCVNRGGSRAGERPPAAIRCETVDRDHRLGGRWLSPAAQPEGSAQRRIQACMAMPAATPALIERVEPNWAIDTTCAAAALAAGDRPGPSWPNNSTHRSGRSAVSSGTAPGRLSTPTTGRSSAPAQATRSSTVAWWRTCW